MSGGAEGKGSKIYLLFLTVLWVGVVASALLGDVSEDEI